MISLGSGFCLFLATFWWSHFLLKKNSTHLGVDTAKSCQLIIGKLNMLPSHKPPKVHVFCAFCLSCLRTETNKVLLFNIVTQNVRTESIWRSNLVASSWKILCVLCSWQIGSCMEVGAGNFFEMQRIFCPNFQKFARKTIMRQTFSLQIFCSCWCTIYRIFLYNVVIDLKIENFVLEIWFVITQLKK